MRRVLHSPTLRAEHAGAREVAVFALAYLTYFGVRAVTEGRVSHALANARELIDLERDLGLAGERAVQDLVLGSELLLDIANAVYIYGHWPVLIVGGVLLFRYRRPQYRLLRNSCLISGLAGLVIFTVFPVAPPRLTDLPVVDTVTQGSPGYRQVLPRGLVNEYAAMPSFHAGWNLLLGILVFQATRFWPLRLLSVAGPAAMVFAVVATANHYIVDVLAGAAIVLLALAGAYRLEHLAARTLVGDAPAGGAHVATRDGGPPVPDRPPGGQRPASAPLR